MESNLRSYFTVHQPQSRKSLGLLGPEVDATLTELKVDVTVKEGCLGLFFPWIIQAAVNLFIENLIRILISRLKQLLTLKVVEIQMERTILKIKNNFETKLRV